MDIAGVDWELDLRYREKSFSGAVHIHVEGAPDPLELDCEKLTIEQASLDGVPVQPTQDLTRHTLSFTGVPAGKHVLEVRYRGSVDADSLTGMYVAPAGASYVLTTMLFPSGSRRLLPAFEHPAIKTVYRLTLTTDVEDRVVFNTPPSSSRVVEGRKQWTFAPTPRMSAYLLYLGVGPFDRFTADGDGRAVSVLTSPGRAGAGKFVAERAKEILAAYEDYYRIPYPLPKLDIIAIENFWAGAMENWGAISARAQLVLVDESTSVLHRRSILATLSHEIAHQWFGNLVTNAWWDDFWLNESFATFVGYRIVQRRYPDEEAEKAMLLRWIGPGLDMDSLRSTHPIHVPVDSPDRLGENSDSVTYGKGAAVLRMIESYVGEESFRTGVSSYLLRHQYSNARAEDLWSALGAASTKPVGPIIQEWIMRPGYPVVRVRWANGQLHLRQEQFRQDGNHVPGVWPIPIRIRSVQGEQVTVFDRAQMEFPLSSPRGLRIDPGRRAFVRVHLEGALFDQALEEFPEMDPFDQWGVVSDLGALLYSLDTPVEGLTRLLERASSITDQLPIRTIVGLLGDLRLAGHGVANVERAGDRFLARQLERVGLDPRPGEPESARVLREDLVGSRVWSDAEFARTLAQRYSTYDSVPGELQSAVVVALAQTGGAPAYDQILGRLRSSTSAGERSRLILGLGALGNRTDFRRALDLSGGDDLPSGAVYELLLGAGLNPPMGDALFDWFREKADELSRMWAGTPLMSLFLHGRMSCLGLDREEAVREYFGKHTPKDAVAGAQRGLENLAVTMRLRHALLDRPLG